MRKNMIISSKHIQASENNIYTKLSALFSDKPYIEITPLQSDLFDSICGSRKLLGKKIAEYPDHSISFFIALKKLKKLLLQMVLNILIRRQLLIFLMILYIMQLLIGLVNMTLNIFYKKP